MTSTQFVVLLAAIGITTALNLSSLSIIEKDIEGIHQDLVELLQTLEATK